MIENTYAVVSNYCTDNLQETLSAYAQLGYKVASTTLLPNEFGVNVLYIFFTKVAKK